MASSANGSNGSNGSPERKFRWVGTRPVRPDGIDKVTGKANFGADFSMPGMLWGRILRSPHAHARIRSIDASRALALDGVKAVVTSDDLPDLSPDASLGGEGYISLKDLSANILARGKALYDGHAVAAVAATTVEIAEQALELIDVDYEPLPVVLDVREAMGEDSPILHDDLRTKGGDESARTNIAAKLGFSGGDPEAGFAEADVVVEREFDTQTVHQGYIEPHACVANVNADGQCMVWCCTQGAFVVRAASAGILDIPISQIKVIPSEIGGGFGAKTTIYLEPVAIALSRKAGRPVKMVMDRREVFRATGPGAGTWMHAKIGAKSDGKITAATVKLCFEAGAFPGSPVGAAAMTVFACYDIDNFDVEGYDVVCNKPKTTAYRAPGAPQAAFAVECVLDELADELGMDPIELRLRNAAREGTRAAHGPVHPRIGFEETLQAAKVHPHLKAPLGPNQGRGIASGFWFNIGMNSSAEVHLNEDGTAAVVTGNPDIGGSRASMALMAAEELGIDYDRIRPMVADTESVGFSDLTGGSRVTFATGMAVIEASRDVIRQLKVRAATIWDCEVDQVEFSDGRCVPAEGSGLDVEPLTVAEVAEKAGATGGPISGYAAINAQGAGASFATHICDVEVDPETGKVDVLRYTAIQDAGKAVHPSYVEGQMQGGSSQGIGWALNEEFVFDEEGHLQNPGFLDYRMPVASDLPMIDTVIVEVPNPGHPYGVRGVGEVPIVPPLAAVTNAVNHATGLRLCSLPLSPPRLLEALDPA